MFICTCERKNKSKYLIVHDIWKNTNSYINNICDKISDIESTSSTHASSTDFDLPEASTVNVENILALSGVSPIKKSKKLGFIKY